MYIYVVNDSYININMKSLLVLYIYDYNYIYIIKLCFLMHAYYFFYLNVCVRIYIYIYIICTYMNKKYLNTYVTIDLDVFTFFNDKYFIFTIWYIRYNITMQMC